MRTVSVSVLFLAILVTGCGGGPTVAEYADEVEALVTTMNAGLDRIDKELDTAEDLEQIQASVQRRILVRSEFVAGLRDLEPPDDLVDLHGSAIEIMANVADAESAMADRVMAWESISDIESIWETPEGLAAREADAKAVSLCLAAQADFDQTSDRAQFDDVPWIPSEMKEIIRVAFGCIAESR